MEQGRVGRGTGVTANGEGGEAVGGDRGDEVESQAPDDWVGAGMRQQQQGVYRACTEQQQRLARGSDSECKARARATTQTGRVASREGSQSSAGAPAEGAPTDGR